MRGGNGFHRRMESLNALFEASRNEGNEHRQLTRQAREQGMEYEEYVHEEKMIRKKWKRKRAEIQKRYALPL